MSKNRIYHIRSENNGGYGAFGININSATGIQNISIVNNSIADILAVNVGVVFSTGRNPYGIRIIGGSSIQVYNNSVRMTGAFPVGNSSANMSSAMLVGGVVNELNFRNNILINEMSSANAGSKHYAIAIPNQPTSFVSNYNNYYVSSTTEGYLGY
jgi:hypothetical protein